MRAPDPEQLARVLAEATPVTEADLPAEDPPAKPPRRPEEAEGEGDETPDQLLRAELELADRFVREHRADIRFCAEGKAWFIWDGSVWRTDDVQDLTIVMGLAKKTALSVTAEYLALAKAKSDELEAWRLEQLGEHFQYKKLLQMEQIPEEDRDEEWSKEQKRLTDDVADFVDGLNKHAKAKSLLGEIRRLNKAVEMTQTLKKLQAIERLARSDTRIQIRLDDLDKETSLLNTPSGMVDLTTGAMRKHDREAFCTRITAVPYNPKARSDTLDKVLASCTGGDAELLEYLRLTLGVSVFGHNHLEKFYLALGPGGSGKGTLFESIKGCLGEYCATAEFQSFVKTTGSRVRDDLARLRRAHLVLASEVEKGETLAAAVLKQITGGDTIAARELYKAYMEFRPRLTLWLQANPPAPRVDDQDSGIWRRLVVVPFGHAVPEDERDPRVKMAMQDPKDGGQALLAWLVSGAVAGHALPRIPAPLCVREATGAYNAEMDPLRDYVTERLRFCEESRQTECYVTTKGLRADYETWYRESGGNPRYILGPKELAKRLKVLGADNGAVKIVNSKRCKCWIGFTLAEQGDETEGSILPLEATHLQVLGIHRITALPLSEKSAREKNKNDSPPSTSRAVGGFANSGECGDAVNDPPEPPRTLPSLDDGWEPPF